MISKIRIKAIAFKEYLHIIRDPFTMIVALSVPLILVLFFGFIVDLDYKNIKINIIDGDNTPASRRFAGIFKFSHYFNAKEIFSLSEAERELSKNNASAMLIIKSGFGKDIVRANTAKVQLLIDGSDNVRSALLAGYVSSASDDAQKKISKELKLDFSEGSSFRTRFVFNSELNSRWFIVPGLATIIIGLMAIILMSLAGARELENGSIELLLATSVKPIEIIIGKIIPYFVLNMCSVFAVFVLALIVFGLPFQGSFLIYTAACVIYVCGALALGMLIAVITRKQQTAIQYAFAVGFLPSFLLSGFIFSIDNMPAFFRYFTAIFPQRWFMEISRYLFLRDTATSALAVPFAVITLFAVLMIFLTAIKFKTDLEP